MRRTAFMSIVAVAAVLGTIAQQASTTFPSGYKGTIVCENSRLKINRESKSEMEVYCEPFVVYIPTVTKTVPPSKTPTPTKTPKTTATMAPQTAVPPSATSTTQTVPTVPVATNTPVTPSATQPPTATTASGASFIDVNPSTNLQSVINSAPSGAVLRLADGDYRQNIEINKPLGITGSRNAVFHGEGQSRIIQIFSSSVVLDGFTIDGTQSGGFGGRLVYVLNPNAKQYLTGLVIRNMDLKNAGGECIRLRYYIKGAIIENNTISNCGRDDYPNGNWAGGGKNGEGIYIGTAPEQTGDGKNPESGPDLSTENVVQNNTFNTQGNECVDFKEGTTRNVVRYNSCTGQKDENSGGFDSRGNENIFESNTIFGNLGAGIRFGGDTAQYGIRNVARGNTIRDNQGYGVKAQTLPQGQVCGNTVTNNKQGASNQGSINPSGTCQ